MTTQKYNLDFEHAVLGPEGWSTTAGWILTYQCAYSTTREFTSCYWQYCQLGVGIAAGSYTDKPTLPDDDAKAIRRTEDGTAWEIVDDFRGQLAYNTDTGEARTVDYLGPLLAGWTLLAPQTPYDKWDGTKWVTDKEAQQAAEVAAAEAKLKQLQDEADEVIERLGRAVKHDMATDEDKAKLDTWERYSVLLSRVDVDNPEWPAAPE
ncbi:TPA: tail fiber assembly protein [Serratia marcescens]|uniref:Tail fiber assembly protein n=1 Tax=Serratia marcescens TaxID=615 RepID=A0A9X8VEI2_SERMA|nr:tail fiber assembly protein [Serratia marcescens]MBS3894942.1 tail fiber assembly protein [Serratia marcescens]HBC7420632.1 tail fiber assembly protein [Serratia marcescens]